MLHSNRVGQGLPISTIIIIAMGLIVLVIIITMVQQRTALFGKGLRQTTVDCSPENEAKPAGTDCDLIYANFKDLKPGEICCRKGTVE